MTTLCNLTYIFLLTAGRKVDDCIRVKHVGAYDGDLRVLQQDPNYGKVRSTQKNRM